MRSVQTKCDHKNFGFDVISWDLLDSLESVGQHPWWWDKLAWWMGQTNSQKKKQKIKMEFMLKFGSHNQVKKLSNITELLAGHSISSGSEYSDVSMIASTWWNSFLEPGPKSLFSLSVSVSSRLPLLHSILMSTISNLLTRLDNE